jgi:hypothetical protein
MALIIHSDGSQETRELDGTLKELQSIVGGYVEHHACQVLDFVGVMCNENGKMIGLSMNEVATRMAKLNMDYFVGTVIFYKDGEIK